MATQETRLDFTARIGGVKIAPAKTDYSGQHGAVDITLHVEMPGEPREPHKPYTLEYERPPTAPVRGKKESDEKFEARQAEYERVMENRERVQQAYDADVAAWRQAVAAAAPRRLAYAQLVGIAAVFGATPLKVTLRPDNQDLLPGFQAQLMAPGTADEPEYTAEDVADEIDAEEHEDLSDQNQDGLDEPYDEEEETPAAEPVGAGS